MAAERNSAPYGVLERCTRNKNNKNNKFIVLLWADRREKGRHSGLPFLFVLFHPVQYPQGNWSENPVKAVSEDSAGYVRNYIRNV